MQLSTGGETYPLTSSSGDAVETNRGIDMHAFSNEIAEFRTRRARLAALSRQRAAFQIMTGIDLDHAIASGLPRLQETIARTTRLLERERLKGVARHWSYDLSRHIALKQALDTLRAVALGMPDFERQIMHSAGPSTQARSSSDQTGGDNGTVRTSPGPGNVSRQRS
ncbi:MAG: hypothetical protein WBA44_01675 [Mesorhizobium sp.]